MIKPYIVRSGQGTTFPKFLYDNMVARIVLSNSNYVVYRSSGVISTGEASILNDLVQYASSMKIAPLFLFVSTSTALLNFQRVCAQVETIISYSFGYNTKLTAPSHEAYDTVMELICSLDRAYSYDRNIYQIVSEEARAYFDGEKSLSDVTEVIQQRCAIYLSEQS